LKPKLSGRHCNSGHVKGQRLVLDVDGNLITKLYPKKVCVYLVSQLTIPVALVNARLTEGCEPDDFHAPTLEWNLLAMVK
jgi:hypothetical protein